MYGHGELCTSALHRRHWHPSEQLVRTAAAALLTLEAAPLPLLLLLVQGALRLVGLLSLLQEDLRQLALGLHLGVGLRQARAVGLVL